MASELVLGRLPIQVSSPAARVRELVVHRRLVISRVLFVSLVVLHILLTDTRPRDLFAVADPLVSISVGLVAVGLALRSWAAGMLFKRQQLATTGPYAWTRNPLYLGSCFMMIGFSVLFHGSLWLWIAMAPLIWVYWMSIKTEEQHLLEVFPQEWPRYAAAVPRFIPTRLTWPRFENWSLSQWRHNEEYQAVIGSAIWLAGLKVWQVLG